MTLAMYGSMDREVKIYLFLFFLSVVTGMEGRAN